MKNSVSPSRVVGNDIWARALKPNPCPPRPVVSWLTAHEAPAGREGASFLWHVLLVQVLLQHLLPVHELRARWAVAEFEPNFLHEHTAERF